VVNASGQSKWSTQLYKMAMTLAAFLALVTPAALVSLKSVADLARLKMCKDQHICKGRCIYRGTGKFPCKNCGKLKQKMCRNYHGLETEEELVSRLVYEYLFGMISIDNLLSNSWMDKSLRDCGHHERMRRLVNNIDTTKCGWLRVN